MSSFIDGLGSLSPWAWIASAGAIALAALAIAALVLTRRLVRRLRAAALAPSAAGIEPLRGLSLALNERRVIRRARSGFRGAPGPFPSLPLRMGYASLWQAALGRAPTRRVMALALEFMPDEVLFACFRSALSSPSRARELLAWMDSDAGAFALRRIALSGPGRVFDGAAARALLGERLGEVRELLGDQEWAVRVFALRAVMGDPDERSLKAVADSFSDPHPLARRLVAECGVLGDRAAAYAALFRMLSGDPSLEVRRAAKARIRSEFMDLYAPARGALKPDEALHLLELLDPADPGDEALAFSSLAGGSEEERLAAAEHLDARGSLERIFTDQGNGDPADFERRLSLLLAAARLHVCGFLRGIERLSGDAPFLLAARLLAEAGDAERLAPLARRWFSQMGDGPFGARSLETYDAVLAAVARRADREALRVVAAELLSRRRVPALAVRVLDSLGAATVPALADALRELFLDPGFEPRESLRAALLRQDRDFTGPLTLSVLGADRTAVPRVVRRDALFVMAELGLEGALQRMMESLPLLAAEETASFSAILARFEPKVLEAHIRRMLDSVDAPSRAAVLSVIPGNVAKAFLPDMKAAIRDADPDVRASAARALAAVQETKALAAGGMDLLRDPVERVRVAATSALAEGGGAAVAEGLRAVLDDANEVDGVKRSLIRGLGRAGDAASLELLVDELGARDDFQPELLAAVSARTARKDVSRLVERLKDATGGLKERLTRCFLMMGGTGQETLAALLEEGISALKPYLVEALEATGYVEARIRELRHRDPAIRRRAAAALDLVGNRPAYRGIVLAARDPDPEVRVAVTKALERLAGAEGQAMLADLEADPDPRVRRYVLWAMERVKAKAL